MPGTAPEITTPPATGSTSATSAKDSVKIVDTPGSVLTPRRTSGTASGKELAQKEIEKEEEYKLKQFVQDGGHFSLVRNFRLADVVTLGNGFCGALSLFSSASYLITHERSYIWRALAFPLAGMIFDALDGKVARWRNESSMLGQELDSLADSISFGVAPAFAAYVLGLRTPADTLILTVFICSGIARLARFNATVALVPKDKTGKSKYFEGLPIPSSLLLVALMAACVKNNSFAGIGTQGNGVPWGFVKQLEEVGVDVHWVSFVWLGWAAMMVSKTLRIPKF